MLRHGRQRSNKRSRRSAKRSARRSHTMRIRCPATPRGQARSAPLPPPPPSTARPPFTARQRPTTNRASSRLRTCAQHSALRAPPRARRRPRRRRRQRQPLPARTTCRRSPKRSTRSSWSRPSSERERERFGGFSPAAPGLQDPTRNLAATASKCCDLFSFPSSSHVYLMCFNMSL